MLTSGLLAAAVSWWVAFWVVRRARADAFRMNDFDLSGPQKFHAVPVPRIGGVALALGLLAGAASLAWRWSHWSSLLGVMLACAIPAFASGLTEDLTKTQSPRRRLFFTAVSALVAALFAEATVTRTGIPGVDWLVSASVGATLLTVLVVAGVANALNIIDGFNGLASMCAMLMLLSTGAIAQQVGDLPVMAMAMLGVAATAGFFVWNYPRGRIFLGDGGAYLLGFWVAESAILLTHRNPRVSPLFPLLVCLYPVFETLFTIYRRKIRGVPAGAPDGIHLHSLIYRRLTRWAVGRRHKFSLTRRNAMTSPYLWMLCTLSVAPAMVFWDNTLALAVCIALFGVVYSWLYWRIVRFRAPHWMQPPRSRSGEVSGPIALGASALADVRRSEGDRAARPMVTSSRPQREPDRPRPVPGVSVGGSGMAAAAFPRSEASVHAIGDVRPAAAVVGDHDAGRPSDGGRASAEHQQRPVEQRV